MKHTLRMHSLARHGFTLVEIILVTVIILILVGIVGPRLVGKSKIAKINATQIQMHNIKSALQEFEIHASRFPTQQEGLKALIAKPQDLSENEWVGPYLEDRVEPKDSFKRPFKYTYPSEHGFDYDLISAGPDGNFGTEDDIALFKDQTAEDL